MIINYFYYYNYNYINNKTYLIIFIIKQFYHSMLQNFQTMPRTFRLCELTVRGANHETKQKLTS